MTKKNGTKIKTAGQSPHSNIITFRLDDFQEEYIEKARKMTEELRGIGANKVTRTEAIMILLAFGMEVFNKKYGNPMRKKI